MDKTSEKLVCTLVCLGISSIAGFGAMAALMLVGGWTFLQAIFVAALVWAALSAVLVLTICGSIGVPPHVAAAKARAEMEAARDRVQSAGVPAGAFVAPKLGTKPSAPAPVAEKQAPATASAPAAAPTEADRPKALAAARDGKADDLKQIKGIGPKLEVLCNTMGFYHFDQIAAWTDAEVAWVDENLEGFKGRVTRDTWVEQAKVLASGGETEFSKRVEGGDVY